MSEIATNRWHKIVGGAIVESVRTDRGIKDPAIGGDGNAVWRQEILVDQDVAPGVDQVFADSNPPLVIEPTRVTRTWTIRALTAQEIADRDKNVTRDQIVSAVIDIADIVIAHIDADIAKGNLVATDIPAAQRAKYAELKTKLSAIR